TDSLPVATQGRAGIGILSRDDDAGGLRGDWPDASRLPADCQDTAAVWTERRLTYTGFVEPDSGELPPDSKGPEAPSLVEANGEQVAAVRAELHLGDRSRMGEQERQRLAGNRVPDARLAGAVRQRDLLAVRADQGCPRRPREIVEQSEPSIGEG